MILEGELVNYRKDALKYTGTDDRNVEEYRISITVNLKLVDVYKESVLWQLDGFVGDTTYFTAEKSESTAISAAIEDLARRVVDRAVDVW